MRRAARLIQIKAVGAASLHDTSKSPMEPIMSELNSMHFYLNWAKERIDEMDAALTSLETKATQLQADSKTKAEQLIADLKKRRADFQARVKAQAEAGESAWQHAKAQLESEWAAFEGQVKSYFETVDKHVEQQQATFHQVAAAQVKAWHEAVEKFRVSIASMATGKRGELDIAVKQMKEAASEAEAQLQKFKQVRDESWSALSAALADSRKAFDRANQASWDAFKRAMSANP
jgi:hypothetical protein